MKRRIHISITLWEPFRSKMRLKVAKRLWEKGRRLAACGRVLKAVPPWVRFEARIRPLTPTERWDNLRNGLFSHNGE